MEGMTMDDSNTDSTSSTPRFNSKLRNPYSGSNRMRTKDGYNNSTFFSTTKVRYHHGHEQQQQQQQSSSSNNGSYRTHDNSNRSTRHPSHYNDRGASNAIRRQESIISNTSYGHNHNPTNLKTTNRKFVDLNRALQDYIARFGSSGKNNSNARNDPIQNNNDLNTSFTTSSTQAQQMKLLRKVTYELRHLTNNDDDSATSDIDAAEDTHGRKDEYFYNNEFLNAYGTNACTMNKRIPAEIRTLVIKVLMHVAILLYDECCVLLTNFVFDNGAGTTTNANDSYNMMYTKTADIANIITTSALEENETILTTLEFLEVAIVGSLEYSEVYGILVHIQQRILEMERKEDVNINIRAGGGDSCILEQSNNSTNNKSNGRSRPLLDNLVDMLLFLLLPTNYNSHNLIRNNINVNYQPSYWKQKQRYCNNPATTNDPKWIIEEEQSSLSSSNHHLSRRPQIQLDPSSIVQMKSLSILTKIFSCFDFLHLYSASVTILPTSAIDSSLGINGGLGLFVDQKIDIDDDAEEERRASSLIHLADVVMTYLNVALPNNNVHHWENDDNEENDLSSPSGSALSPSSCEFSNCSRRQKDQHEIKKKKRSKGEIEKATIVEIKCINYLSGLFRLDAFANLWNLEQDHIQDGDDKCRSKFSANAKKLTSTLRPSASKLCQYYRNDKLDPDHQNTIEQPIDNISGGNSQHNRHHIRRRQHQEKLLLQHSMVSLSLQVILQWRLQSKSSSEFFAQNSKNVFAQGAACRDQHHDFVNLKQVCSILSIALPLSSSLSLKSTAGDRDRSVREVVDPDQTILDDDYDVGANSDLATRCHHENEKPQTASTVSQRKIWTRFGPVLQSIAIQLIVDLCRMRIVPLTRLLTSTPSSSGVEEQNSISRVWWTAIEQSLLDFISPSSPSGSCLQSDHCCAGSDDESLKTNGDEDCFDSDCDEVGMRWGGMLRIFIHLDSICKKQFRKFLHNVLQNIGDGNDCIKGGPNEPNVEKCISRGHAQLMDNLFHLGTNDVNISVSIISMALMRSLLNRSPSDNLNDGLTQSLWGSYDSMQVSEALKKFCIRTFQLLSNTSSIASESKQYPTIHGPRLCATLDLLTQLCISQQYCRKIIEHMINEGNFGLNSMISIMENACSALPNAEHKTNIGNGGDKNYLNNVKKSAKEKNNMVELLAMSHNDAGVVFNTLQCAIQLAAATILGQICNVHCMSLPSANQSSSIDSQIIKLPTSVFAHTRRALGLFAAYSYTSKDSHFNHPCVHGALEVAISQTSSRDLTQRALKFQFLLSSLDGVNESCVLASSLFASFAQYRQEVAHSLRIVSQYEHSMTELTTKCEDLMKSRNDLVNKIAKQSSTFEREVFRARAEAKADAMEVAEIQAEEKREAEQKVITYRNKLEISENMVQKIREDAETYRADAVKYKSEAASCVKRIDSLENEVQTLQTEIREKDGLLVSKGIELEKEQSSLKCLQKQLCSVEEERSALKANNGKLQLTHNQTKEDLEDVCFKLISLVQVYEAKEKEMIYTHQKLNDELGAAKQRAEKAVKRYGYSEEKVKELKHENHKLQRKLEKTVEKMNRESNTRRPIGPVAYMNSIHDDSMNRSERYHRSGKENEFSFGSKRLDSRTNRKSNFRINK